MKGAPSYEWGYSHLMGESPVIPAGPERVTFLGTGHHAD